MNKKELTKDYRKKGWRVQKPEAWSLAGEREIKGRVHKIYQVAVKDPNNSFGLAEVAVLDDGKENDEQKVIEMAVPLNWEDSLVPFEEDLRDFLDETEKGDKKIFAIKIQEISKEDELAEIVVYNKGTQDVLAEMFVVRRRGGTFKMEKIINP